MKELSVHFSVPHDPLSTEPRAPSGVVQNQNEMKVIVSAQGKIGFLSFPLSMQSF